MYRTIPLAIVALVVHLSMTVGVACAYPSAGESYSSCRGTNPNKMSVTNLDAILNLGIQLVGKEHGPLLDGYDLEFVITGDSSFSPGSWYQDQLFYLQVVNAPTYDVADLNEDTFVGELDFDILENHWAWTTATASQGNINEDGYVDAADVGIMFENWTGDSSGAVPEPSSLVLAALVLCVVMVSRTR